MCGSCELAKSANITLGMIRRTFIDNNCKTFLELYQSLVRPKLDYCVQSWRPYLKKDIGLDVIDKVQRRATRFMVKDRSVGLL